MQKVANGAREPHNDGQRGTAGIDITSRRGLREEAGYSGLSAPDTVPDA